MLARIAAPARRHAGNGDAHSLACAHAAGADVSTGFVLRDKSGGILPVFITRRGSCYVRRTSGRTGRQYRYYLPKGVSLASLASLGLDGNQNEKD